MSLSLSEAAARSRHNNSGVCVCGGPHEGCGRVANKRGPLQTVYHWSHVQTTVSFKGTIDVKEPNWSVLACVCSFTHNNTLKEGHLKRKVLVAFVVSTTESQLSLFHNPAKACVLFVQHQHHNVVCKCVGIERATKPLLVKGVRVHASLLLMDTLDRVKANTILLTNTVVSHWLRVLMVVVVVTTNANTHNTHKHGECTHCYLVDPASGHMLVLKIKPCMPKFKL